MQEYKEVHGMDRRDLQIWGAPLKDEAFLADYNAERKFWEAGGRKKGQMDGFILYQLAKKHHVPEVVAEVAEVSDNSDTTDETEPAKRGPGRPRKEPALA